MQQRGGGVRGVISGFSSNSRRRLLRKMASVNKLAAQRLPAWITLTYPSEYPTDPAIHKSHLRALLKRFRRKWGDLAVVWRLEWQRRGAPHYHLVAWDFRVTQEFRRWLSKAWYECVGSGDEKHLRAGTNASQADSWRGLTAYLSKYMAKESDDEDPLRSAQGRIWGVECGDQLPIEPVSWLVSVREGLALRRVLQRHRNAARKQTDRYAGTTSYLSDRALSNYVAKMTKAPISIEGDSGLPSTLAGMGILPD